MTEKPNLVEYLWTHFRQQTLNVGVLAGLGAIFQTGCLITLCVTANDILSASDDAWRSSIDIRLLVFLVLFAGAAGLKTYALRLWTRLTERAIAELVMSTSRRLSGAELQDVENLGEQRIMGALSSDTKTVSSSFWSLLAAFQTLTMLVCALAALMFFALEESMIISVATVINFYVVYRLNKRSAPIAGASYHADERFQQRIRDQIVGFQDLRMDRRKSKRFINKAIGPSARAFRKLRLMFSDSLSLQISFFFLYIMFTIGFILFIGPNMGFDQNVFLIVGVYFYLLDRIELLSAQIPQVSLGNMTLSRILELRDCLPENTGETQPEKHRFSTITLQDVVHNYRDQDGQVVFSVGPINLECQAGRIYLIQGGNGSGKSTLMKLLTGLYTPEDGQVLLDGSKAFPDTYRSLFSTVFTDFHLFNRIYGVKAVDLAKAEFLLRKLQMDHKVRIRDGAFTTTDLSTGQRKRLALIAACLEDRPILVLDEWTADQDPEFRLIFFSEVLPWLKSLGHTIFAVTHDDQYFAWADVNIRVESGKVRDVVEHEEADNRAS